MSTHRTTPAATTAHAHRPGRRAALAGLALATAALLVGCSSSGSDEADAGPTTTAATGASTTVVAGEAPVANDAPDAGGTESGGTDGGGGTSSGGGTNNGGGTNSSDSGGGDAPTPTGAKPVITSFTTPESIDCHNGDFQEFSASWTTTGATETMISIDGPGGYETYGPDGSDSLPFSCSSAHTFLLTATSADGQTATRSITLQPRNVQAPDSADDSDADTDDAEVDVED